MFAAAIVGVALLVSIFDFLESSSMEEGTAVLLLTIASLAYAYLLYAIGSGLRYVTSWSGSSRILRIGGAALASVVLFVMTFGEYAQVIIDYSYKNDPTNWMVLSLAFNALFVGFLVFALIRAIKFEEYIFAFSIVRLFGLYLLIKYFTLFYSMFDTGIFFMVGGILFITGGWALEKKKDMLVTYMKGSTHKADNYGQ